MFATSSILASAAFGLAFAGANLQHASGPRPLLTTVPSGCIAIEAPGTRLQIVLDRGELAQLSNGASRHVPTAERRMALIRAGRASSLLADTSARRDGIGCYVNSSLVAKPPRAVDWVYLVFHIFKQGHGRVWDARSGSFLKNYLYVTYGDRCGWCPAGFESLRSLSGESFLQATLYVR